jgi:hypothetical protein
MKAHHSWYVEGVLVSFVRKPLLLSPVALLALSIFGISGVACESNNQSLVVLGAIYPVKSGTGGAGVCSYDPTGSAFLQNPRLDIALGRIYTATFAVESQLVSREDFSTARSESNRTVVTGAEVKVLDGAEELDFFSVATSGSIIDPRHGRAAVPITVISQKATDALNAKMKIGDKRQITVFAKLSGATVGNVNVTSGEYQFVVTVCKGCLVVFPPESRDPAKPTNNCDNRTVTTKSATDSVPCVLGQDEAIDCRICSATNPGCQPPP